MKVVLFGMARVCGPARSSEILCAARRKECLFCFFPIKIDRQERAKALQ